MITLFFIMLVLALCILFQEYRLNKLNRDYMSLKEAYCIHFVDEHIMPDWDKVAHNYLDGYPINNDDVRKWAINLLINRKDWMKWYQWTLYQQMIVYVENKIKTEFPVKGILEFKNKDKDNTNEETL